MRQGVALPVGRRSAALLLSLLATLQHLAQAQPYASGLDFWCTYNNASVGGVVARAHQQSAVCNNIASPPPTTAGVWSACQTTDAWWTQPNRCMLPGSPVGPASNLPWNTPTTNLCQSQAPTRALLVDNPVSQTPYGYAYFMTDYNLVQYITIALDGQNVGQPLFRYADPTNYVKVYVNSWAAYTANPVLTYQYNSTYWPTELNAPDPFSCATVSVSLRNVCNPATSVYFPSASTLAPVSQGGNYGCLCTNGMGQGAAACPTLDLSQPGTVVAIAVIAAVGNYTNLAAGCGNSVGTIVMGMYAQQYIVPNCYVPRPPASPPPPPSPPPPSPPTPPPGPSGGMAGLLGLVRSVDASLGIMSPSTAPGPSASSRVAPEPPPAAAASGMGEPSPSSEAAGATGAGAGAGAGAASVPIDAADDTCIICYDGTATCVFLDCGHGGFCQRCAYLLYVRPPSECPTCRAAIEQVVELAEIIPIGSISTVK